MAVSDTWYLELFLSLNTLVWGVGILNPWLSAFSTGPVSFALLSKFPGGESAFGLFVTTLACLNIAAVLRGSRPIRAVSMGVAGVFWFVITIAIGVPTNFSASVVPTYGLLAFSHWVLWVRLRRRGVV